jgi:glycosyltransferase involved in cell wall biosynthesis
MAAAKPIVASDLPSIREVLNDQNACLIQADNAQALAEGIKKALSDKNFSQNIALQSYEDVHKYTWENRAKGIIDILRSSN